MQTTKINNGILRSSRHASPVVSRKHAHDPSSYRGTWCQPVCGCRECCRYRAQSASRRRRRTGFPQHCDQSCRPVSAYLQARTMNPVITAEQLLLIADEYCAIHRVTVRDFGALVAAASVPGARINGIPVYADRVNAGEALARAVARLEPLSDHNREFGAVCRDIYHRYLI